jgi:hypothetical protein
MRFFIKPLQPANPPSAWLATHHQQFLVQRAATR